MGGRGVNAPAVKAGEYLDLQNDHGKGWSGWNQTPRRNHGVAGDVFVDLLHRQEPCGSTQPEKELFAGTDWSRVRDIEGKETVINRPLSFPLAAGKVWEVHYTEQHPNAKFKSEEWNNKYTVVGYESIEVPAGKFNAWKIEAEGRWTAELEPTQTVVQGAQSNADGTSMVTQTQKTTDKTVSGRTYKAFWYVPEVKRWVKSVEEYYGSGGVRNERYTGELESFKLAE